MLLKEKVKKQFEQILDNPFLKELEAACKLAINEGLTKLNIVNYEEFSIQNELLSRMRQQIQNLEEKIVELEKKNNQNHSKTSE